MEDINKILKECCEDIKNQDKLLKSVKQLDEFISNNTKVFAFNHISTSDHNVFTGYLLQIIKSYSSINCKETTKDIKNTHGELVLKSLISIRLLSRDKTLVESFQNIDEFLHIFVEVLNLDTNKTIKIYENRHSVETLKCLCNWVYLSSTVRQYFKQYNIMTAMLNMIPDVTKVALDEYLFYMVRVMFLISALESTERSIMLENKIISSLTAILKKAVHETNETDNTGSESLDATAALNENIMGEILKALFNVTLELTHTASDDLSESVSTLVIVLREMLLKYSLSCYDELLTHIAHMFVNIPKERMLTLITKTEIENQCKEKESTDTIAEWDMRFIDKLLDILVTRMQIKDYTNMKEKTIAVITAFCYICRICPTIRKYLRSKILPAYVPSDKRPEENDDVRGMIVRLMTTVDISLKNMAADFLFVLCKENTDRLIRYAGYGNSAGYLASQGLMIPGMVSTQGEYSDDELTDVDDDEIDMMTGAKAVEADSTVLSMTEEEKEIEAQKLMSMMERLSQLNVIKPMKISTDGKLTEIDPSNASDDDDY